MRLRLRFYRFNHSSEKAESVEAATPWKPCSLLDHRQALNNHLLVVMRPTAASLYAGSSNFSTSKPFSSQLVAVPGFHAQSDVVYQEPLKTFSTKKSLGSPGTQLLIFQSFVPDIRNSDNDG